MISESGETINLDHLCGQDEEQEVQALTAQELADRGWTKAQNRRFRDAYADLSKSIELAPEDFSTHLDLAVVQSSLGDTKAAVESIEQAQRLLRQAGRESDVEALEPQKLMYLQDE